MMNRDTQPKKHLARALIFAVIILPGISGCATAPLHANIVQSGTVSCYEGEVSFAPGKPATCELSAVAQVGNTLVFANDKAIPNASPVFSLAFDGKTLPPTGQHKYFPAPIAEGIKYEAITVTPDGKQVIASTAFDRRDEKKPDLDHYNILVSWPAEDFKKAEIVSASNHQGVISSVSLAEKFLQALGGKDKGIGYFKIEGLAAIPDNKLLFGIRAVGADEKNSGYTIRLVEVGYRIEQGKLVLQDDFKPVFELDPSSHTEIPHKLGLSSVEYDPANNRLYLLTSFEESDKVDGIGAYLWVLPLASDLSKQTAALITGADSKPLVFSHKAEGLAVLSNNRALVIHDDDRIITKVKPEGETQVRDRKLNESVFDILQLAN